MKTIGMILLATTMMTTTAFAQLVGVQSGRSQGVNKAGPAANTGYKLAFNNRNNQTQYRTRLDNLVKTPGPMTYGTQANLIRGGATQFQYRAGK